MSAFDAIARTQAELVAIRQDIHAHPELGMEEHRTAELVARKLEEWGIEVHRGVGGTGVVGVLRSGNGEQAIGLRADMDALPMEEANNLPYRSTANGRMHACGHDGHTTMLLGAARYLAETRAFNGTVNFIFQPGEEGCGGALAMLKDGLFERFPCNQIFAMHNRPGLPVGQYAIRPGPTAAGGAFFDITVEGKGSHGARPEAGIDPVLAACHITAALQSIVSRTVSPMDTVVVSVTKIAGGDAYNIIPQFAKISGTARFFSDKARAQIETGLQRVAEGVAAGFGASASLDFRLIFAPTINAPEQTERFAAAAAELVGEDKITRTNQPGMGSEDFSFMMQQVPGAYLHVGNGDSASVHNQHYNFNDEAIPYGAALLARVIERELPRGLDD
ncbi:M20 aminoacylase family protein [Paeniroseomonas aquatica]|uniref:M20 aminoacylase family protein n=1 Tax=Paeniroseomonas aquatica TaxID=373043 RepID=A0ABT8A7H0_9PROT|nr:M20 aminoacylase family protein [Paeniroseomonas aquatica]MDN3565366.1 M20 aminoacylase family protein [Paeniroseomonas aquatica]